MTSKELLRQRILEGTSPQDEKLVREVDKYLDSITEDQAEQMNEIDKMENTSGDEAWVESVQIDTSKVPFVEDYKNPKVNNPHDFGIIDAIQKKPVFADLIRFSCMINIGRIAESPESDLEKLLGVLKSDSFLAIRPKTFTHPTDYLNRKLPTFKRDGSQYNIKPEHLSLGDVLVSLKFEDLSGNGEPLSHFDRWIASAFISCMSAKNKYISDGMIFRTANGTDNAPSPEQLNEIHNSMKRLNQTYATMTIYDKDGKRIDLQGYLLNFDKGVREIGGQLVEVYIPLAAGVGQTWVGQIILSLAERYEYIEQIPLELLGVKDVSNTKRNIVLRECLLTEIHRVKGKRTSDIIKYSSLFESMGLTDLSRVEKQRLRDTTKKILDHFKKEGHISGYEEMKQGRSFYGIKITK